MTKHENNLSAFMTLHKIQGEHLHFTTSCHTAEAAAQTAGITKEKLVKNICLLGADGKLIVGIVKGEDRISRKRVAKYLTSTTGIVHETLPRIATAEEVLEKTGYPCGGVPSFGFSALFLIDPKVTAEKTIYTGGGSEFSLVKMAPAELARFHEEDRSGLIVRIRG